MTRLQDAKTAQPRAGQRSQERRPDTADVYLYARQLQSQAIADLTAAAIKGAGRLIARTVSRGLQSLRTARARRQTVNELMRLDARALRDIGVDPSNVEAEVDRLMAREHASEPQRASLGDVVRQIDQLMAPLRQWDLSRRTAGQMARMNRETLDDLGYDKGHVDTVPDQLAERRTHANRNRPADRAA